MDKPYLKDFDKWNQAKKLLADGRGWPRHVFQRQIWWCSLGVNIGSEEDGKNENFERPVLVLRHINQEMALVAPFSSTHKADRYLVPVHTPKMSSVLKISQLRVVSKRRFLRYVDSVDGDQFSSIQRLAAEFVSRNDESLDQ